MAIRSIRLYKVFISPSLSKSITCRFHPTCSEYAVLAFKKYGFRRGLLMSYGRIRRCRPDNNSSCIDFP
ncbi:MAG: membrane protein insertion efficiency factor YidD [Deltaproteobacteria bacterium]|nr:membrane protein insertion efficiency factor YidD [Deltaproteobacteria bacterium]